MLVLSRKSGQKIRIAEDILITVLECRGDTIRIGIDAPKHVVVLREELYQDLSEANQISKVPGGVEHHTYNETHALAQLSSHWAKHRQESQAPAEHPPIRIASHLQPLELQQSSGQMNAITSSVSAPRTKQEKNHSRFSGDISSGDTSNQAIPQHEATQTTSPNASSAPQVMITLEQLHEVLGEVLGEQILANLSQAKSATQPATQPQVQSTHETPVNTPGIKTQLPKRAQPQRHKIDKASDSKRQTGYES
jgi:carbon storage regulator